MASVVIMEVLSSPDHDEGPCPIPSSPMLTVVDQFDEDEFPDIPPAPAALLAALRRVPDPRDRRGIRHPLTAILAVAACAVVAGARSFRAIADWVADTCPALRAPLGVTTDPPAESTIRRTLQRLDGNGLDRVLGAWAALHHQPASQLRVIAIDGKSVRGSASADARCRHLLSALDHGSRMVLGQIDVDTKTNEIPMFTKLWTLSTYSARWSPPMPCTARPATPTI